MVRRLTASSSLLVSIQTSSAYLLYCRSPGRFTAAYQMKTMLAYLIATYDIETDKELHPMRGFLEKAFSANMEAKVRFKRRQ